MRVAQADAWQSPSALPRRPVLYTRPPAALTEHNDAGSSGPVLLFWRSPGIPNDYNLSFFIQWYSRASPEERRAAEDLYIVAHAPGMAALAIYGSDYTRSVMKVRSCFDVGCLRCTRQ